MTSSTLRRPLESALEPKCRQGVRIQLPLTRAWASAATVTCQIARVNDVA